MLFFICQVSRCPPALSSLAFSLSRLVPPPCNDFGRVFQLVYPSLSLGSILFYRLNRGDVRLNSLTIHPPTSLHLLRGDERFTFTLLRLMEKILWTTDLNTKPSACRASPCHVTMTSLSRDNDVVRRAWPGEHVGLYVIPPVTSRSLHTEQCPVTPW